MHLSIPEAGMFRKCGVGLNICYFREFPYFEYTDA